jgi:hypothetical protein
MKIRAQWFSRLATVLLLPLALVCTLSAQSSSPNGSFGFLINDAVAPTSTDSGAAVLGVINFDGAGNATGTYNFQIGTSDSNAGQSLTGAFTGTYSTNPDGTGSLTVNLDLGFGFTFATVTTDGGKGMQWAATACTDPCDIRGGVISGIARAAAAGTALNGSYGSQFNNSPLPGQGLTVLGFDGAGNVAVSLTFVGVGSGPTADPHQAPVFTGTATGTYSLNPDGSGTIVLPSAFGGGDEMFGFVVVDGGSEILALQMHRSGNGVSSGIGRLQ